MSSRSWHPLVAPVLGGIAVTVVIVIAVVLYVGSLVGSPITDSDIQTVQKPAASIIDAIARYRAEKGKLPDSLGDLVPGYLASIPPPSWGLDKWEYLSYGVQDGETYELSVFLQKDDYARIICNGGKTWWVDQ